MAKTWDIESGMGRAMALVQGICRKVRQRGGIEDDLRRLLGEDGEVTLDQIAELIVGDNKAAKDTTSPTYPLTINYDQPLAEMVAAGKYDSVNSDITAGHFPISGTGCQEVEVELFCFGRMITSDQVLAELDQAGYRPARIEELLTLGAKHPDLQRQFPIIALGSQWRRLLGGRDVSSLGGWRVRRELRLNWFEGGWLGHVRFLAVRLPAGKAGK